MEIEIKRESKTNREMNRVKDIKIHIRFDDEIKVGVNTGIARDFKEKQCVDLSIPDNIVNELISGLKEAHKKT